jgi:hypothetical protein
VQNQGTFQGTIIKSPVSVAGTLSSALRFLGQRPLSILRVALVPLALGWMTLYFALDAYLAQLAQFLRSPSPQVGSLALGLVAAGLFLTLLFHCVLAVGLTEAALDQPRRSNSFFRAGVSEWRLYAAYLRVLLLAGAAIAVPALAGWAAVRGLAVAGHPETSRPIFALADAAMLIGLVAIAVRIRFLLAPIVVMENGPVLRRALTLSRGNSLRLLVITTACFLPGLVVQFGAETLVRRAGLLPPVDPDASFQTLVALLRGIIPEFVTITMAAYFVTLALLVGAAASVYRVLTEEGTSPD